MTLSNQQRDALYDHVANLLSESVQDTRDLGIFETCIREITSVAKRAMCDVGETWNRKACGPICTLPIELLAQCFSWLDLADRAKVTVVSRYLRSVALGQPSLWAQIELTTGPPHLEDALALLLERSGRATLDVDIWAWSKAITAQLTPHVSRMRTLDINLANEDENYSTAWIFEQPAPMLEVLKVFGGDNRHDLLPTVLPSPTWAPRLRKLALPSTFVLPRFCGQFDRVTYFSGLMTAGGVADTDARSLFEIFPSLEFLRLSFGTDTPVNNIPNTRIPHTLVDLRIDSEGEGHSTAAFLALCHGHPFKHVQVVCSQTWLCTPMVEQIRSVASPPWHLEFDSRKALRLDDGAIYEIYATSPARGLKLTDFRTAFDCLGSIVVMANLLRELLVDLVHMPALQSITLTAPFSTRSNWDCNIGRLCAPKLQALRIEPCGYEWLDERARMKECSEYTEGLVQRLTLEDGSALPKVSRLVFSMIGREYIDGECWAWMYSRASSVYVEDDMLWQQTEK